MRNKLPEPPERLSLQLHAKAWKIKIKEKIKKKIKIKEKDKEKIREKITCLQLNCNGRFSIYSLSLNISL